MKTFDIPAHFRRVTYNETESKKNNAALTRAMAKLAKQLPGFKRDRHSRLLVLKKNEVTVSLDGNFSSIDYVVVDPGWIYRGKHPKLRRRLFHFPVSVDKLKTHIKVQELLILEAKRLDRERDARRAADKRLIELTEKKFEAQAKKLKYPFDTYGDIVGFEVNRNDVRVTLDWLTHAEGLAVMKLLQPFAVAREKRAKQE